MAAMPGCFIWHTLQRGLCSDYNELSGSRTSSEGGQQKVLTLAWCVLSSCIMYTENSVNLNIFLQNDISNICNLTC